MKIRALGLTFYLDNGSELLGQVVLEEGQEPVEQLALLYSAMVFDPDAEMQRIAEFCEEAGIPLPDKTKH